MIGTGGMRCKGAGRGIEPDFGPEHADTFRRDLHADLRANYVLANPPFNITEWWDGTFEGDPLGRHANGASLWPIPAFANTLYLLP